MLVKIIYTSHLCPRIMVVSGQLPSKENCSPPPSGQGWGLGQGLGQGQFWRWRQLPGYHHLYVGETLETLKRLNKITVLQRSLQIIEEVNQKLYNSCSEKFKKTPWKTSTVVYFELMLAKKTPSRRANLGISWESCHDGFLFYKCSRSKLL